MRTFEELPPTTSAELRAVHRVVCSAVCFCVLVRQRATDAASLAERAEWRAAALNALAMQQHALLVALGVLERETALADAEDAVVLARLRAWYEARMKSALTDRRQLDAPTWS